MIDWTKPIRTTDGRAARVLCTDRLGDYPIVIALTLNEHEECIGCYSATNDSFENIPERIEGWVNVYEPTIYQTKEEAATHAMNHRIACIKISFEKGEGI